MIIDFQITGKCNLDCKYCFDILKSVPESDINKIIEVLNILKQSGVTGLVLTGGEPMLHRNFKTICIKAKEMGFYLYLSTNGNFIDSSYEEVIQKIDCIGMPIDCTHGDIHAELGRPSNQMDITVSNILYVKEVNPNIQVKIGTVVNSLNYKKLDSIKLLLDSLLEEKDVWRLYEFNPIGNGKINLDLLSLDHKEFIKLKRKYVNINSKYRIVPMEKQQSENAYIFVGPDMHLLKYDIDDFYDYGDIIDLGLEGVQNIFKSDMKSVIDKSVYNRKWIEEDKENKIK